MPEWANSRRCDNPSYMWPYFWLGFPTSPPMAMVVGAPYIEFWQDRGGRKIGDLAIYCADEWPGEPDGGIPLAPVGMLQSPERTLKTRPIKYPAIWPFRSSAGELPRD